MIRDFARKGPAADDAVRCAVQSQWPITPDPGRSPMLDWTSCPAAERRPERVSGAWVFRGTRVPVKALFENVEGGAGVADFVQWFRGVTKQQVDAVLEHAARSLNGPEAA
jgi:uncharacterized protein (DUF433 family)